MPAKPSVFISYRRQPAADLARYIHHRLTTHRYDVFLDVETINGGRFANIIQQEIISRDVFVVILTPETLQSEWVVREIKTALDSQKPIIPLAAQGFSFGVPLADEIKDLSDYDAIRWDNDFADTAFERLVKAIDPNYKANARPSWQGIAVLATVLIILVVIVALLVPGVLQPASVPTESPAPTTAIPFVDMPTGVQIMNLDMTATEIILQRTVDAKETEISQSFAESTQIAAAAQTQATATREPPRTTATAVIDLGSTATEALLQRTVVAQGVINATLQAENTRIVETSTLTASPSPTPSKTPTSSQPPTATSIVPTATQIGEKGYPCDAQTISHGSTRLNVIRVNPSSGSSTEPAIQQGVVVRILQKAETPTDSWKVWYHIASLNEEVLGWIPAEYIVLSFTCPE
jgi:hypothetical protein